MACSTDKPRDVLAANRKIPDFSHPLRECDCSAMTGHCGCPAGLGRVHRADVRQSGARRSEPNAPGMGTLSPRDREALLLRLEAFATAPGEPTRYAENTVQADLVSAFRDGDRHYLLCVPAGGKPVRIDVTGRLGALFAYLGGVVEKAGL